MQQTESASQNSGVESQSINALPVINSIKPASTQNNHEIQNPRGALVQEISTVRARSENIETLSQSGTSNPILNSTVTNSQTQQANGIWELGITSPNKVETQVSSELTVEVPGLTCSQIPNGASIEPVSEDFTQSLSWTSESSLLQTSVRNQSSIVDSVDILTIDDSLSDQTDSDQSKTVDPECK